MCRGPPVLAKNEHYHFERILQGIVHVEEVIVRVLLVRRFGKEPEAKAQPKHSDIQHKPKVRRPEQQSSAFGMEGLWAMVAGRSPMAYDS